MTDYKRLTDNELVGKLKEHYYGDWTELDEVYLQLAEFEDKAENGTLVESPCKIGDVVYFVCTPDIDEPVALVVKKISIDIYRDCNRVFVFDSDCRGGLYGYRERENGDIWYIGKDKKTAEKLAKEWRERDWQRRRKNANS